MSLKEAADLTQHFGAGMWMGLTCGSITGGLMVLGLYGADEAKDAVELIRRIFAKHEGRTQRRYLLHLEVKHSEEKKPHCDKMVYDAVEAVEDILLSHGIPY